MASITSLARRAMAVPAALLLVAATSAALRAQLPAGVQKGATVEGITEYTLDNGLRVLLFPDASKPTATVNITTFKFGFEGFHGPPRQMWYDDVAVAPTRIGGCP